LNKTGVGKGKSKGKRGFAKRREGAIQRRSGIARVLRTPHVHPLTGWTIPAFPFPAEASTPEGWKAELALGGWLATHRNICPAPGVE